MTPLSEMMSKVRGKCPLVHFITNYVTVNDCANMCICCGGSPVMTDAVQDVEPMVVRAANNIEGVQTTFVGSLNVVDILNCDKFIISQDAVKLVEEVYAE